MLVEGDQGPERLLPARRNPFPREQHPRLSAERVAASFVGAFRDGNRSGRGEGERVRPYVLGVGGNITCVSIKGLGRSRSFVGNAVPIPAPGCA
jgi:hypothetical protein